MEKTLRSALRSSSDDFLSAAAPLASTKLGKSAIKTLIWSSIPESVISSLPPALHHAISRSITSFKDPPHSPPAPSPSRRPSRSPPPKRTRSAANHRINTDQETESPPDHLKNLRSYTYITHLCVSHPKKPFPPPSLLPAARSLHDSLVVFENDPALLSAVAALCEEWWRDGLPGREKLISQSLPYFLSRSIEQSKKADVRRLFALREAFTMFDYDDDESIEDVRLLLVRCIITPVYLKVEEGRRFLAFIMGLNGRLAKEVLALLKSQIPMGRKSVLEAYSDVIFRAWKGSEGFLRDEIEDGFLQGLIEGAIYARTKPFGEYIRRVLGEFISQRATDGVEKLLFRLAEPVLFRSLQVANSNVRQNALRLLLDLFPLEDPDVTKEVKDALLEKQFFLLDRLLVDECPDVRAVAVEGSFRILHHFWEVIHSSTITKSLTKIVDNIPNDLCSEVRMSTVNGIIYLLDNPQSHEIMKVLLPRLGFMFLDPSLSVRVAVADLLLAVRDIRTFQFNKVVGLDALLSSLANDHERVAKKIARLLIPSYFPTKVTVKEACSRCIALIKRSPLAGARFCEFALQEGSSSKSLVELLRITVSLALSPKNLNSDQIDGMFIASASICRNLLSEPSSKATLGELFSDDKLKCLFKAAASKHAQTAVLSIASILSLQNVAGLHNQLMDLINNSIGVPENVESQVVVRAVHNLMVSCGWFDDLFGTLTNTLQAIAFGFLTKFNLEVSTVSSLIRRSTKIKGKSSMRSDRVDGKGSSNLSMSKTEEDLALAAAAAWQMKDLLTSTDSWSSVVKSPKSELAFSALNIISQVSIEQCLHLEILDTSCLVAYTTFAMYMSQDVESSKEQTIVECTLGHLLNCAEKLFQSASRSSGCKSSTSKHEEKTRHHKKSKSKEARGGITNPIEGGECKNDFSRSRTLNVMKVATSILMFIADSATVGLLIQKQVRCLRFASAYSRHVISEIEGHQLENLNSSEQDTKHMLTYLRSSFTYAAKLLHLVLTSSGEALTPPPETSCLANDLLDLIAVMESYLGSKHASQVFSVAKPWLPILLLGLGSKQLARKAQKDTLEVDNSDAQSLPVWLATLSKTELNEVYELSQDGQDCQIPEVAAPVFSSVVETMVLLLRKGDAKILDVVGCVFLTGLEIGLRKKDFGLVLGLVHFICVKLLSKEYSAWEELEVMPVSLREIYLWIERDLEGLSISKDGRDKLENAKSLLRSICMNNV